MIKNRAKAAAGKLYGSIRHIEATTNLTNALVQDINHRLVQYDGRLDQLRSAYNKVDPYQPLYGLSGFGEGQRGTKDRCEAIYKYFSNDVDGMRILDVGCYAGYATFYFADRGAHTVGTDNRSENIEICNLTKEITGVPAEFKVEEFSPESIKLIKPGAYDAVMILSVLHWTIHDNGLKYVQKCMADLLEKVPMVIVELAQKGEDKKLYWDKAMPKNDLDIFAKAKDIKIEKIGTFPTHLSDKRRPIYVVTKKHVTVNNNKYAFDKKFTAAYEGAPKWRPINSEYYIGKDIFLKQYNYNKLTDQTTRQTINEINFFLQNESVLNNLKVQNAPKLLDFEIGTERTTLVFSRLKGRLLDERSKQGIDVSTAENIASQLLEVFAKLEEGNLFHNDIRSWNILIDGNNKPYVIDFELVSGQQIEDNYVAFFWAINTMLTGERESGDRLKTTLPPRKNFEKSKKLLSIYDAYAPDEQRQFNKFKAA